jgi:hypothetical protein
LEEAAYVDQAFFYETVAPLLLIGVTSLICISTLTSDIKCVARASFLAIAAWLTVIQYMIAPQFLYTPIQNQRPHHGLARVRTAAGLPPTILPRVKHGNEESTLATQVMLACSACRDAGLAAQCKHMLHLVPQWQSSARHERLKAVMSDRPDLIQSELAGLAFDALQQCFRTGDIDALMNAPAPALMWQQPLYMVIDPAAGGPQSDFALISFFRHRGQIVVCLPIMIGPSAHVVSYDRRYSTLSSRSKSSRRNVSLTRKRSTSVAFKTFKKRAALYTHIGCSPRLASSRAQYLNLEW